MFAIERLHHVSLCVTDLERAKQFYGTVLGLREVDRPDLGFGGAWYALGGNQQLHLIVHAPTRTLRGTREIDGRDGHFAMRVASYDAAVAHLRARGVEVIVSPRNKTPWAQVYFTDPDGNVIELNVDVDPRRP
ncbi:MAG TPA: VOC family protein [Vicinamibacterales bacterium]|nr:VOC family protein [Vicinamibacterales bacterium]